MPVRNGEGREGIPSAAVAAYLLSDGRITHRLLNDIVRAVGYYVVHHCFYCGEKRVIKNDMATITAKQIGEKKICHHVLEPVPTVNENETRASLGTLRD